MEAAEKMSGSMARFSLRLFSFQQMLSQKLLEHVVHRARSLGVDALNRPPLSCHAIREDDPVTADARR
jgi:hypothetical protein